VGTVHHGNIIEPIRSFLSSSRGSSGSATYIQASALHVDVGRKVVVVELPGDASFAPTVAADTDAATVAATSAASGTAAATTAAAAGSSWWPFGKAKAAVPAPALALPPGNYSSGSNSGSGANGGPAGARAELSYDKLVIAVGARPATFGIKGVEEHAFFLKELDHSAVLQQRLLACLEHASALLALRGPNCAEVHRLLHFVVVGGGPTGVELAAELSDFVATDVKRLFPSLVGKVKRACWAVPYACCFVGHFCRGFNTFQNCFPRSPPPTLTAFPLLFLSPCVASFLSL
jgi:NADH dehydrogenase FAD-containing subunit